MGKVQQVEIAIELDFHLYERSTIEVSWLVKCAIGFETHIAGT